MHHPAVPERRSTPGVRRLERQSRVLAIFGRRLSGIRDLEWRCKVGRGLSAT